MSDEELDAVEHPRVEGEPRRIEVHITEEQLKRKTIQLTLSGDGPEIPDGTRQVIDVRIFVEPSPPGRRVEAKGKGCSLTGCGCWALAFGGVFVFLLLVAMAG